MEDSECSGTACDGDGDDGENAIFWTPFMIVYASGAAFFFVILTLCVIAKSCESNNNGRPTGKIDLVLMLLVALLYSLAWLEVLALLVFIGCGSIITALLSAPRTERPTSRQRQRRTVTRQHSGRGRWADRGWLVVMRARYQRKPSAARGDGWAARLTGRSRRSREVTIFNKATRRKAAERPNTSDIDVEAGTLERKFVWAVVTVVEMEEEGLRHQGLPATEGELNRVVAIRRLLMRVSAVRAISSLWVSDTSCVPSPSEEMGGDQTAQASTARKVPVVRRRRRVRHTIVQAMVR
eukprot:g8054.t1